MDKYLLSAVYDLVADTEPTHYTDTFFTRTWHYDYMGTQISFTYNKIIRLTTKVTIK